MMTRKEKRDELYKHFGVMIDCSRNAVMKPTEVKRLIDFIAKMDYNTASNFTPKIPIRFRMNRISAICAVVMQTTNYTR